MANLAIFTWYNHFIMSAVSTELSRGVLHAADLRQRLDVSPATLMRAVREERTDVIPIGRGRATHTDCVTPGRPGRVAFSDVSNFGDGNRSVGGRTLHARGAQTVWMPAGAVSDGLPIELTDARPSGFLGRHCAAAHADLRLPARLMDWSDHHVLLAMSRRGEDAPGNLLVGDESFARWQAIDIPPGAAASIRIWPRPRSRGILRDPLPAENVRSSARSLTAVTCLSNSLLVAVLVMSSPGAGRLLVSKRSR